MIRAEELSNKIYLVTEDEVDASVAQLRKTLLIALQEGKKRADSMKTIICCSSLSNN